MLLKIKNDLNKNYPKTFPNLPRDRDATPQGFRTMGSATKSDQMHTKTHRKVLKYDYSGNMGFKLINIVFNSIKGRICYFIHFIFYEKEENYSPPLSFKMKQNLKPLPATKPPILYTTESL